MINEASRELKKVQDQKRDIPLIKKVLETLKATKKMMMDGIYNNE